MKAKFSALLRFFAALPKLPFFRKLPQTIVFVGALLCAAVYFVYTLAFSSGWALGEWLGDFFTNAQLVNHELYRWGVWLVVAASAGLITNSHKNRCFYVGNFLSAGATVALMIKCAAVTGELLPPLREQYLLLEPMFLNITIALNFSTVGVKIFDYGLQIADLLYVWSGVIVVFVCWKSVTQMMRAKKNQSCRREASHEDCQH
ncbi:MAG: hypothetical protein Q8N15_06885 [Bacillota bacterium]|nr:hypothetical protein [Bacillota bacterium]